jgi:hypothetical protein
VGGPVAIAGLQLLLLLPFGDVFEGEDRTPPPLFSPRVGVVVVLVVVVVVVISNKFRDAMDMES